MPKINDRVRHQGKPAEPFLPENAHGRIARSNTDRDADGREIGPLRITPAVKGIPAMAYVQWDEGVYTWEKLSDLTVVGKR